MTSSPASTPTGTGPSTRNFEGDESDNHTPEERYLVDAQLEDGTEVKIRVDFAWAHKLILDVHEGALEQFEEGKKKAEEPTTTDQGKVQQAQSSQQAPRTITADDDISKWREPLLAALGDAKHWTKLRRIKIRRIKREGEIADQEYDVKNRPRDIGDGENSVRLLRAREDDLNTFNIWNIDISRWATRVEEELKKIDKENTRLNEEHEKRERGG